MKLQEDETAEEARSSNLTQALALLFVTIVLISLFLKILFW
ncbi:MAG: hypothetical protein ABI168_04575 [Ginsengibacter sp.]